MCGEMFKTENEALILVPKDTKAYLRYPQMPSPHASTEEWRDWWNKEPSPEK